MRLIAISRDVRAGAMGSPFCKCRYNKYTYYMVKPLFWLAFWRSKPDGPDASVAAPEGLRQSRAAKTGTPNTMDICFIGLGNMGAPMARRLIEAGHTLIIYDTRNDAVAPLVALGAKVASSPQDVADRVETVMASLPEPQIVAKVAVGEGGLLHGKRIKRFVDLSTTGARMAATIATGL